MATGHDVIAQWTGVNYIVLDADTGETWVSENGNDWRDGVTDAPVQTEEFEEASIRLCGGPRNGETVS